MNEMESPDTDSSGMTTNEIDSSKVKSPASSMPAEMEFSEIKNAVSSVMCGGENNPCSSHTAMENTAIENIPSTPNCEVEASERNTPSIPAEIDSSELKSPPSLLCDNECLEVKNILASVVLEIESGEMKHIPSALMEISKIENNPSSLPSEMETVCSSVLCDMETSRTENLPSSVSSEMKTFKAENLPSLMLAEIDSSELKSPPSSLLCDNECLEVKNILSSVVLEIESGEMKHIPSALMEISEIEKNPPSLASKMETVSSVLSDMETSRTENLPSSVSSERETFEAENLPSAMLVETEPFKIKNSTSLIPAEIEPCEIKSSGKKRKFSEIKSLPSVSYDIQSPEVKGVLSSMLCDVEAYERENIPCSSHTVEQTYKMENIPSTSHCEVEASRIESPASMSAEMKSEMKSFHSSMYDIECIDIESVLSSMLCEIETHEMESNQRSSRTGIETCKIENIPSTSHEVGASGMKSDSSSSTCKVENTPSLSREMGASEVVNEEYNETPSALTPRFQKIIMFGACGNVGLATLKAALRFGYEVTTFLAKKEDLTEVVPTHVIEGDMHNKEAVTEAIKSHDAVILVWETPRDLGPATHMRDLTESIFECMVQVDVKRIVLCCSFYPYLFLRNERVPAEYKPIIADHLSNIKYIKHCSLESIEWVTIVPPKILEKPARGHYGVRNERPIGKKIVKNDLAEIVVRLLTTVNHVKHFVGVGYPGDPVEE